MIGPQDEHRRAIVSLALHVANQACLPTVTIRVTFQQKVFSEKEVPLILSNKRKIEAISQLRSRFPHSTG